MGVEIERKFRVKDNSWKDKGKGIHFHQGYLTDDINRVVRVRVAGDEAFLTIKGINKGTRRAEFEYPIAVSEANSMLSDLCLKPTIEKHRYRIDYKGKTWEIDEFHGENEGLIIAEIELISESEIFEFPPWLGEEVSHDPRYYNSNLVSFPFSKW
ncbi:CYTH domain-containing protein [Bacteroidota bacterium]